LRRRLAEEPAPTLLLNVGKLGMPRHLGLARDAILRLVAENGFSVVAFQPRDIELAWEELVALSSASAGGLRLVGTNLAGETTSQALPFQTFHLAEVGGVRVGILSLIPKDAEAAIRERGLPYRVEEPAAAAKRAVRELRRLHRADLVVLVSHLKSEDDPKVLAAAPGIDVLLGENSSEVVSRRRVVVELSDWNLENHDLPALRARLPRFGLGEILAELRPTGRGLELARLEEWPLSAGPQQAEAPEFSGIADDVLTLYLRDQVPLLPDPRKLWPRSGKKVQYDPLEFWNLAGQLLRRETGAEVAVLRITGLASNVTGELPESYPREWSSASSPVRLVRLPGRAVRSLLARLPPDRPPIFEGCCGPIPRRYDSELWLSLAGLDRQGRVSGVPLSDDELYSVATTEEVLRGEEPAFSGARDPRPYPRALSAVLLDGLKGWRRELAPERFAAEVRRSCEGKTPLGLVWRINLRELSLQLADTQVDNNQGFSETRDARVQSTSQLYAAGKSKLYSELYWNRWRWDAGVSADYGRVTIRPRGVSPIVNETQDRLVLDTELRHRTWSASRASSRPSLGPFGGVAYDTEFTKPEERAKREFVRYRAGLKLFDGAWLKEIYAGGAAESDHAAGGSGARYGWTAGLSWASPVPATPASLKLEATYLEFAPRRRDTPADLKRQLDLTARLSLPLFRDLRISSLLTYFLFEGSVVKATGHHLLLGVSLDYSRLWKPFY